MNSSQIPQLSQKVDNLICYQLRAGKSTFIPALFLSIDSTEEELDFDDLTDVFSHFGDIIQLEIFSTTAIVLFSNYFDAKCALDFLSNSSNYVSPLKGFYIRWYTIEDESVLTKGMHDKFENLNLQRVINEEQYLKSNFRESPQVVKLATDVHYQYLYYGDWTLSRNGRQELSTILEKQRKGLVAA